MHDSKQIYLLLADGSCYPGRSAGVLPRNEFAELCFTTGMSGYVETLTDPGFSGQIILQTFPLIGCSGYNAEDMESKGVYCKGYCAKHISDHPSNFRSQGSLDEFLKKHDIVGITGIDTRALTRKLREEGVMNAVITDDPSKIDLEALQAHKPEPQVPNVSVREVLVYPAELGTRCRVALLDTGVKQSVITKLQKLGCEVTVYPYDTKAEKILESKPDGIVLGGGPGEPEHYPEIVAEVKKLSDSALPLMGISLGHHLLAAAHGFKSEKMKYGHRGENHCVQDVKTKKIYVTAQNHGHEVREDSIDPELAEVIYRHVQDHSVEGLSYKNKAQFSVEFSPEACGGPLDTEFLFERFTDSMEASHATR